MTERYSRDEIEEAATHINLDGYEETAAIIRQLLADRDKLIAHIRAIDYCVFSHDSEFTGESLKALIEEVGK